MTTYTDSYAILEVSEAAHREIAALLREHGYSTAIHADDTIDMRGIALRVAHYDERRLPSAAEQQLRVGLEAWASYMAREVIGPKVPVGVGFVFVLADHGRGGNMAYCSSIERADAMRLLRVLAEKWGSANDRCRRCSECRGEAHHWLEPDHYVLAGDFDDDDDAGIIVQRCKHCSAVRTYDDSEER